MKKVYMTKPKILITGGAGYIGNILVKKLFQAKERHLAKQPSLNNMDNPYSIDFHSITVVDNLMYKQVCLTDYCYKDDFNFIVGDVRDESLMESLIASHDIIIPLAAIVGFPASAKDEQLATSVNYKQIKTITERVSKDQLVIYPNTNSGYGVGGEDFCTEESPLKPQSHYGLTKVAAEECLLRAQKTSIVLRLATVFGISPRMRLDLLVNDFTYKAFNDKYLVLFEPHFRRNYIHIQDVAMTFIFMIHQWMSGNNKIINEPFNVGLSSANLSKFELAEKIKTYIPDLFIATADISSDPDKRDYIVSNKKLESIGWNPYYSLDMVITELLKAYKIISNYNKKFTNL